VDGTAGATPRAWVMGSCGSGPSVPRGPCVSCGSCTLIVGRFGAFRASSLGEVSWACSFSNSALAPCPRGSTMLGRITGAGRIPCAAALMRWQVLLWCTSSARGVTKPR
jgi:hypothetical protein